MRITYIANARIPTERANGIQIIHTCEALAKMGVEVELVVPWRFNPLKENPYQYYGVKENFSIRKLPSLDFIRIGKLGFFIQEWTFILSVFFFLIISNRKDRIIYARGERVARGILFAVSKRHVFLETHMMPSNFNAYERTFSKARGVVVVTKHYEEELRSKGFGNVLCAPDGVTISDFDIDISKQEARKKLGLPLDKRLVVYTGQLYSWKGADVLADAAQFLPENTVVIFIGGSSGDLVRFKEKNDDNTKILIVDHCSHKKIPLYLKAADVLVLPNTGKETISRFYTSPVKLFEYMASGRPIVASDLPSIRDILNKKNSVLVHPDNPTALALVIKELFNDITRAVAIAEEAHRNVGEYTWDKRASNLHAFIKEHMHLF